MAIGFQTRSSRRAMSTQRERGYRADIDGLRALAVLLVVAYHVWGNRVSGGVDVFLMISAFFLTLSFTRRASQGAALGLGTFWLRRFRRLLPAAAVTIAATLAVGWLIMPPTTWPSVWREGWASLLYFENWALAATEVDYYARAETIPSPLQHFWSLSVQGQVFLLWPVVFALGALIARAIRSKATVVYAALFSVIFIASLAFSVWETSAQQELAYFDTRTRLWEFAAGTLVALALPHIRVPRVVRVFAAWLGVIGIAVCGVVLDVRGGFPGYLALWPVICTALVIFAGSDYSSPGPGRLLGSKPLLWLGKRAYALYLVHWPVFVFWMHATDDPSVDVLEGAAIVALSIGLAWLLAASVERPLSRFPRPAVGAPGNAAVIILSVVLVAAVLVPWQTVTQAQTQTAVDAAEAETRGYPGARVVSNGRIEHPVEQRPLLPAPTTLDEEWVSLDGSCRGSLRSDSEALERACLQTAGASRAEHLVLVIGDSHAQQMTGALIPVAEQEGWGVVALLQGGCALGLRPNEDPACAEWREAALEYALELRPDAVMTVVTAAAPDSNDEKVLDGTDAALETLNAAGIEIWGVRDNPRFTEDMYQCALDGREDCSRPLEAALAEENPAIDAGLPITPVDFTPWLCPDRQCDAVIGNVAVYLDNDHLTAQYAATLADALRAQIEMP